jgi:hypothetical protein
VIRRFVIAARPWTKRLDAQLIHHILMVLFGCPILWRVRGWVLSRLSGSHLRSAEG